VTWKDQNTTPPFPADPSYSRELPALACNLSDLAPVNSRLKGTFMADAVSDHAIPKAVPAAPERRLRDLANCIRFLSMDAVQQAKSGHPSAPLGMTDIATVLFRDFMRFDAAEPHWIDRDRFILSNGHASMLLYSLLYLTGYKDMPIEELKRFRQVGSKTPGHPEYRSGLS
jgi:hypothetical protein